MSLTATTAVCYSYRIFALQDINPLYSPTHESRQTLDESCQHLLPNGHLLAAVAYRVVG